MTRPDHKFIWHELNTTDIDAAAAFYGALLGWTIRDEERETYLHFYQGGDAVAGLVEAEGGQPPHWQMYVGTSDMEAYAERAEGTGAKALSPLLDIPGTGKLQVFADPEGGVLAAMQPADADRGSWNLESGPGRFCWVELMCDDVNAEVGFYKQVAGWDTLPMDVGGVDYHILTPPGGEQQDGVGGVMQKMQPGPTAWLGYIAVEDVDAMLVRAKDLGAQPMGDAIDVGEFGRCGLITDPTGAVVALYQSKQAGC